MKATGIVRKIDELGRVVIPMELRKTLDIKDGDPLEIFVDGERVVLKKYAPGCISCGSLDNLKRLPDGKLICAKCLREAK
jgi:transcriptional pleiotropic regulator of transition state genes